MKKEDIHFPEFLHFSLNKWIEEENMTEKEKENHKNYKINWGYLKTYKYKEAFKNSFNSLSQEEKEIQTQQLKALPNFNSRIFEKISWIYIE